MKLIYKITIRISVALLMIMAVWATLFYFIIVEEINDETDDSLEDYSEYIITRALAGDSLPSKDNGTNNTYYITEVTHDYASENKKIRYSDEMVYLEAKKETEPARILRTIYRDAEDHYYELTVAIPTIEKDDLQETILWWVLFLYCLLLVVVIIINVWVLHTSFRPLYRLIEWINNFTVGKKLEPLVNPTNVTEFRKLNEVAVKSAERNGILYEQQKEFIGHASHELQTPLAICKNRLEILSDDGQLTEKQLETILRTRQTLDHIIKLNKTLLLLTKIENGQFPEKQTISVNELVEKLSEDYVEIYAYRNITFKITHQSQVFVSMNETLASILFNNLIKNAFTHNIEGGEIDIFINQNCVKFSNTSDMGALNSGKVFKRFYQGVKKEGSTGLGLALVDSIVRLYGMDVLYDYQEERHVFTVRFLS